MKSAQGADACFVHRYISLFIDDQMRKGMKDTSEEEVEQILDKVRQQDWGFHTHTLT